MSKRPLLVASYGNERILSVFFFVCQEPIRLEHHQLVQTTRRHESSPLVHSTSGDAKNPGQVCLVPSSFYSLFFGHLFILLHIV